MEIKNIYRSLSILLLFLLISIQPLRSQNLPNISFEKFKTENIIRVKGLSQNMVNCIMQDEEGYMWFGTWDGLNQFDGYDFRIYNKLNGMSNPTINALLEDNEGTIWAGTQDGLNSFNRKTKTFKVYKNIPDQSNSLSNNIITNLYQDTKGFLWISTVQGLNRYDIEKNIYTRYNFYLNDADSTRTNWINKVIQDKEGFFWIGTRHGLFKLNDSTMTFTPFFHDPDDNSSIGNNSINDIYVDSKGKLWIGTRNGLDLYLGENRGFKHFRHKHDDNSISSNIINAIFEDSRGVLWIGTQDKLNIFDSLNESFFHYEQSDEHTSLSNNDIRCIYEDDMGSIWIGTYNGVNKVTMELGNFYYYYRDPDNPASLSSNIIYSIIMDDKGLIWLGTGKGVNIFNRISGKYELLHYKVNPFTDLSELRIRSLYKDSRGYIWIGTNNEGLLRYDPVSGVYKYFTAGAGNPEGLISNGILWVTEDHQGNIWICTNRGLSRYQPSSGIMKSWVHNPRDKNSISNNQVWTAFEDSKNVMWFGTNDGLNKYDPDHDNFVSYKYDPENPNSIGANSVFGIYEDRKGNLWIGTMGGGLNHFDRETEKFTRYDESNGLPNNVVYISLEDKNGFLWLTTNWGISRFNPETKEFVNYDIHDGLQGNEYNGGAWYLADNGEMFFGGMDGFNSFIPEKIKQNENLPRIVITSFKKFNQPVQREFNDGDSITMNYDDNFFSIEFSALDFTNPIKNKYRYKLENYDEEWNNRDASRRVAEYTRVSPGSYVFKVIGSNNDGYWNPEPTSLNIIIRPPWWDTIIFRIIFGALIFAMLWSFIYWRIRTIKRKHEVEKRVLAIEKELFDIQQKALQLQMNPHFIFNSLNAIQSFVISSDTDKAIHYLSKFSQLMRLILANSREASIPVKDELKAITHYMDIERLRFDNKFDYKIVVDPEIDQEFMDIPPMIIQPFVENAILHGLIHSKKPGHILIKLSLEQNFIFCTIEDNGIGRKKAQEIKDASGIIKRSRGMLITRERLEILNKQNKEKFAVNVIDLEDENGIPTGTRVEINILYYDDE